MITGSPRARHILLCRFPDWQKEPADLNSQKGTREQWKLIKVVKVVHKVVKSDQRSSHNWPWRAPLNLQLQLLKSFPGRLNPREPVTRPPRGGRESEEKHLFNTRSTYLNSTGTSSHAALELTSPFGLRPHVDVRHPVLDSSPIHLELNVMK